MTGKILSLRTSPTICRECAHHVNKEPGSPRRDIWYNQVCSASPLPRKLDPVLGVECAYTTNDLGREVFVEDGFEHCRDVNDGSCEKFSARAGVAAN